MWTFRWRTHSKKKYLDPPDSHPRCTPNPSKQLLTPRPSPPPLFQATCSVEDAYFIICKIASFAPVTRTAGRREGRTSTVASFYNECVIWMSTHLDTVHMYRLFWSSLYWNRTLTAACVNCRFDWQVLNQWLTWWDFFICRLHIALFANHVGYTLKNLIM